MTKTFENDWEQITLGDIPKDCNEDHTEEWTVLTNVSSVCSVPPSVTSDHNPESENKTYFTFAEIAKARQVFQPASQKYQSMTQRMRKNQRKLRKKK
eukprot:UN03239